MDMMPTLSAEEQPLPIGKRERLGVAIEDSVPASDDPDGYRTVEVSTENPFFAARQDGSGNGI